MSRQFTKTTVIAIMNKRVSVPETMVGKKALFTIQGDGTLIDVKDKDGNLVQSVVEEGTVFQKHIFNLQANSGIAMKSAINKQLSADGLIAEKAGDFDKAHELYVEFLNSVQMSFSVPSTSAILAKLGDRVDISARIVKVTTENGSLLTIDPSTIAVAAPVELKATTFSFDDADETEDAIVAEDAATLLTGGVKEPELTLDSALTA